MNSTKLSAFCDKVLETSWLLAVIVTPLFFNVYSSRVFEPDKLTTLRTIATIMAAVWLVKHIEERVSGRHEIGFTWRTPLVFPTLFTVVVYLLSTILSVNSWVSLLGSYQRLQGTYTTVSYIVVFLIILQGLRTRAQLDRLITVIILNSLPIALYGLIQRNKLDPLPWGGDVTVRVASNMGNPIFVAAYLIMIFPITVGRIAESFKAILTEEEANWADILRAAGYIFVAAVELIAIWYAQSRGPLLGLIASSYFLFLLLALSLRTKWSAVLILTIVAVVALVVSFLAIVNIPGGPLQHLQRAPWLGRLGEVFDFETGTGKVRALIWEGMVDLILPHEPIRYPDGHSDPYNSLRSLVGYGPESIIVAYNRFYPPLLAHYESRTASPDRSHDETLDSLAITGLLGLIAYTWLFVSVFYYSFKWLGLVKDQKQRNLLLGLVAGMSVASVAFFWWWQGLHFFGAALTLGIAAGLGIYLAIVAIISSIRLLKSNENSPPPLHPYNFLIISLVAAVMAHFIEINFGIAIASTRTTFWAYAGVLVLAGMGLIREREEEPQSKEARGNRQQKGRNRRKRRKATRQSTRTALGLGQFAPAWLGSTLAVAIVSGFILGTLAFNFITNAERLESPARIIWRALTVLPAQGNRTSYGALMIFALTWLMSAVISLSETAKGGAFRERKGDAASAIALYVLISLAVGLGFALVLASRHAALVHTPPQALEELANRVAGHLTSYYVFIVLVLIAGGAVLLLGTRRQPRQTAHPWGVIALTVLAILVSAIVVRTNLHTIQADIVFKQGDPYERDGKLLEAIELYKHAIGLAPKEDFYYLYLGRVYLQYAQTFEDPAVRDRVMRWTEQALLDAREINPLNTDHSANLARMYQSWSVQPAEQDRQTLVELSSQHYENATNLSPQNVLLWNEWATLQYYFLGNKTAFEQTMTHSLKLDPEFYETWIIQGDVHMVQNEPEKAIADLAQALELNLRAQPGGGRPSWHWTNYHNALAWYPYGYALAITGQHEDAIAAFLQLLELAPNANYAWDCHRVLAIAYRDIGQISDALHHAQMALQLAPEDQQPDLQNLWAQLQQLSEGAQP